jgi:hypothetical protein
MGITVWTFRHVAKRLIETSLVAQRPGQSPPKLEVKNLRVDVNDDAAMLIEPVKLPVKDSHVNFGFEKDLGGIRILTKLCLQSSTTVCKVCVDTPQTTIFLFVSNSAL